MAVELHLPGPTLGSWSWSPTKTSFTYARSRTPRQDTYRSTAILPLVVGDTCLGTLNFGCVDANRFPLETVADLGQIATWIALQLSRFETH